jgi:hypothetical protein
MAYAQGTSVTEDRSRAQIERDLMKYGASHFGYSRTPNEANIFFTMDSLPFQLSVDLPKLEDFRLTGAGNERSESGQKTELEKEVRRRWRSLAAVIKGILVAVDDGIFSLEQAMMGFIVDPSGRSLYEAAKPTLEKQREQHLLEQKD